jgi:hypothetical protein
MATGPEMLLRALGVNPEEIKTAITDTVNSIRGGLQSLEQRLKAIEETQGQINLRLLEIHRLITETEEPHSNGALIAVISESDNP